MKDSEELQGWHQGAPLPLLMEGTRAGGNIRTSLIGPLVEESSQFAGTPLGQTLENKFSDFIFRPTPSYW